MMTRSGSQDQDPANIDASRCDILVQLADLIIRHENFQDMIRDVFSELRKIVPLEIATLSVHDRINSQMHFHSWELASEKLVSRIFKHEQSLSDWAWEHQEALIVPDLRKELRQTPELERARKRGIICYCVLPLTTAQGRLGVLGLGSSSLGAYANDDLWFLKGVAGVVSIALENLTTRQVLEQQKQHIRTLVSINRTLVIGADLSLIFPSIADLIRKVAPVDLASLIFTLEQANDFQVVQASSGAVAEIPEASLKTLSSEALKTEKTIFFRQSDPHARDFEAVSTLLNQGLESGYCIPLATTKGARGTIIFATTEADGFDTSHVNLLQHVAVQVAIALDNAQSYREIAGLRDRLAEEKFYLEDEISTDLSSSEIIGESQSLKQVLAQVKTVASKDATVLILGETGTGKELIARAVHRGSSRKDRSFIKVNCAAIPTGLLESELFGHEKGAFTGAITQKIGRLELADGGTLFLDEVGDIPLELQPKLLRVLQDQEFERLGSNRTLKVNIRLVAATNRKLSKLVQDKQFRSDLFYRLSVFPVHLPALRERRSDARSMPGAWIRRSIPSPHKL